MECLAVVGAARMTVDGREYAISPGEPMLAFPNIVHGYRQVEGVTYGRC